jgi:hypothetical protein
MQSKFYHSSNLDTEKLARELATHFRVLGYKEQVIVKNDQVVVQLNKWEIAYIIGMSQALTVMLRRESGGMVAYVGKQAWFDKAAVSTVSMFAFWPLAITAGTGTIQQVRLANHVWRTLESLARQQDNNVVISDR